MSKVITAGALCTGCGACENICPKSCVIRIKEDAGFQMQKGDGCVDCGLCSKVCPVLNMPEFAYPQKAYAAWAKMCIRDRQCTPRSLGVHTRLLMSSRVL